MKRIHPLSVFAAAACMILVMSGCKKDSEVASTPEAVAPAPEAPAEAAPTEAGQPQAPPAPARDWDQVVAEIVQLRASIPMSNDKRDRMIALQDEILAAVSTDTKAKEAYQNLSRIINGR